MFFNNPFDFSRNSKLLDLEELKKKFDKKGYKYLWEIPDDDPDKDKWIKLMNDLGILINDPCKDAKSVEEIKLLEG